MSFRAKLLLAFLPLALAPLAFFGLRARGEVADRLGAVDERRVAALADVIEDDLARESAAIGTRLERLTEAMAAENRFRRAVLGDPGADRAWLLDYAGGAMRLAGLDLLRIQDEEGRVLSSGHFRNEYDVVDPALPAALRDAGRRAVLVSAPTASGPLLALARARSLRVGTRELTVVGGTAVDDAFLGSLARGTGLDVRLLGIPGAAPGAEPSSGYAREVEVPVAGSDTPARLVVRATVGPLEAILRGMDRWLLGTLTAAAGLALLLAVVASERLSRPVTELARKAERVDLDREDVAFDTGAADEVGALSRVLDRMTARLRASAGRLREAERRATIGEIARQVNHDVRNGLVPIRNVVSHLAQLAAERPEELPAVFRERQGTLESSVEYLHGLAGNYARLSPRLSRESCDLNAIAREVADGRVRLELTPGLPPVEGDPVALRRIVENLIVNALESLEDASGGVTVATKRADDLVVLEVKDTGRGMAAEERARIFEDFYTTKERGTGLGLSIVRRLVGDLGGRIDVDSAPGKGTRFSIELPARGRGTT